VTFEFNDAEVMNIVSPNPYSGRGSDGEVGMTLNITTQRPTQEEEMFTRGKEMVQNFQF
jgi:hypothetical protein